MSVKYSPSQALDLIRKIINEGGYIAPSRRHARNERMPGRDVDMQDLEILLLETGVIVDEAIWDEDHSSYKYRIKGTDSIDDELTAIIVIDENNWRVKIVTVF